jgi:lipid-A-disaccharide synthase
VTAGVNQDPGLAIRTAGPRVMLSCGEASGDLYAGGLIAALRLLEPDVEVFGFGGPRMAAAGARLSGDFRGFSVTGLIEALRVVPRSWRMIRHLGEEAARLRPDVFVAIDFPDFNFRLLPIMARLGIPVVYYVSPQLWAWRQGRIETIKKYVDRMLVIFPFEAEIYQKAGVPVVFVGHPMVDLAVQTRDRLDVLESAGLDSLRPVVALLPGSRRNELTQILPTLIEAALLMSKRVPGVQFLVARAPSLDDELFTPLAKLREAGVPVSILTAATDDVLSAADVVVTASGTATVQVALHGRPMVVVYRLAPLTYAIARPFVRVHVYGMVNLVAGRPIVTELIQDRFTAEAVASEITSLLTDNARAGEMRQSLAAVRARLGAPGASMRAATAILEAAVSPASHSQRGKGPVGHRS